MKEFMGRKVSKEKFALGVAGQIERTDDHPATPPQHRVTFRAEATVSSLKHKFTDAGTVEETTILTIDPHTFAIFDVVAPPPPPEPDPELPLDEDAGPLDEGDASDRPLSADDALAEAGPLEDDEDAEALIP